MVAETEEAIGGDTDVNVQVGRIVHIVHPKNTDRCMPAIVVQVWGDSHGVASAINAVMFPDGSNDGYVDQHCHPIPERLREIGTPKATPSLPPTASPWLDENRTDQALPAPPQLVSWETSVGPNNAVKTPRSWHWPRRCEDLDPAEIYGSQDGQTWFHIHKPEMYDPHNCGACIARQRDQETQDQSQD